MSSGIKRMIINTRERAVSTDINRLQAFAGAGLEDLLRTESLGAVNNDSEANGVMALVSSTTTPLTAVIYNGMMAQPQIASTDLFITPGVALFTQPDSVPSADDSFSKLIDDPGVTTPGALTLSPNAGPGTRIDVVEVQRQDVLLESSSRDIFNTATGFFAPATVDKVKAYRGSYRIRTGTPGGGYPGSALGWLPLMVAAVPAGAPNWDTVRCWDVRPLLADYENGTMRSEHLLPVRHNHQLYGGKVGAGSTYLVRGQVESTLRYFKAGGTITNGGLDIVNIYCEPSFAAGISAAKIWSLYALFPQGLPRWCEYTPSSAGIRKPGGFRGIPVASLVLPDDKGYPASALTLPTFTAMSASGSDGAICLASGNINTGSALLPFLASDKDFQMSTPASANDLTGTQSGANPYFFDFVLNPATGNYPQNAAALKCRFIHALQNGSLAPVILRYTVFIISNVTVPGYTAEDAICVYSHVNQMPLTLAGAQTAADLFFELPLYMTYPDVGSTTKRVRVQIDALNGPSFTSESGKLRIQGWRM